MSPRLARIEVHPLRLPFREEFRIARGSVGNPEQGAPHIYVRAVADDGAEGWGECRPSHRWSYETEESVVSTIADYLAPSLAGLELWDLRGLHAAMDSVIAPGISTGAPVAKCGVDLAVHDLLARRAGVPLIRFLGGGATDRIRLTYIVSVAEVAEAERRAAAAWEQGYRGFKVKIGADPAKDLEMLRAVRGAAPEAFLWADANQGYDLGTALAQARKMEPLNVACLEQPVPANDWTGLRRIAAGSAVPIGVDESVFSAADLIQLIKLEACDVFVMKLSKMGGLYRARLATQLAREAGLGILGSGLTESRLGLAAHVHMLAAYGGCAFADLNGPQFLADDATAGGIELEPGLAHVPSSPGVGVAPDPEKVARYRSPLFPA
jgi:L-alanine-DL-glutamate epimerase-like enolase superfamily enzyme